MAASKAPLNWTYALFVLFGAAQLAAAVVMFFAYNWRALPDLAKIALPQAAMAASFFVFAALPRRSPVGEAAGALGIVLVGVSMAVVGQVYQLGADPWGLFAVWAVFALPLALVARSDAYFALWFMIASTAYNLWAEQVARPLYGFDERVIPASYAALAALVLIARDFLSAPFAGPAPRWQRWFIAFWSLVAATIAGVAEAAQGVFRAPPYGSAALFIIVAGFYALYRGPRPDRPTRSLALFALALWVGAFGLHFLWSTGFSSAGGATLVLLLSAGWIVGVTAGLARLLRSEARSS